ncbi:MAG: hypothetical protein MJ207_00195 [Bacilli bacterium]|nr:hypothetical protein [Bacilli bacterium]
MKLINIKKEKDALKELSKLKRREYVYSEIRIDNIHLKHLNLLVKDYIFTKNAIYVRPSTLWATMKSGGRNNSHNFHALSIEEAFKTLNAIDHPKEIYESLKRSKRYIIVTDVLFKNKINIIVIIEKDVALINKIDANINKIITIYPKDKISLLNNKLLYKR